jgi:hypothetical protein
MSLKLLRSNLSSSLILTSRRASPPYNPSNNNPSNNNNVEVEGSIELANRYINEKENSLHSLQGLPSSSLSPPSNSINLSDIYNDLASSIYFKTRPGSAEKVLQLLVGIRGGKERNKDRGMGWRVWDVKEEEEWGGRRGGEGEVREEKRSEREEKRSEWMELLPVDGVVVCFRCEETTHKFHAFRHNDINVSKRDTTAK